MFHQINIWRLDPNDGFIRTLSQAGPTGEWRTDLDKVAKALKGSSIVVIMDDDGPVRYRVFYQDPELYLREHFRIHSSTQWRPGKKTSWPIHGLAHRSYFRFLQPRCTAAGDAHNCRSGARWGCGYQCDMERWRGTRCEQKLVQVIGLGSAKRKHCQALGWTELRIRNFCFLLC